MPEIPSVASAAIREVPGSRNSGSIPASRTTQSRSIHSKAMPAMVVWAVSVPKQRSFYLEVLDGWKTSGSPDKQAAYHVFTEKSAACSPNTPLQLTASRARSCLC
jgi:hypothetical protein